MGNWADYKDTTILLERDMYRFISEFSYDFTQEEREIFSKAYSMIQDRQNKVIEDIRKTWRKF